KIQIIEATFKKGGISVKKKFGKTLWTLSVATAFATALAACGGGTGTDSNDGSAGGQTSGGGDAGAGTETVTLRVWGDLGNQAVLEEPYKLINEKFMEKHPNIKIQYDFAQ